MALDPEIADKLQSEHRRLRAAGELLSDTQLDIHYATFAARFGPDSLQATDGEALLELLHGRGEARDSLVYWLEFKNDEEFPGPLFGRIGGGSALKFGIYRSSKTQEWMIGPGRAQRVVSAADAIAIARQHRDELVAGAGVLATAQAAAEALDFAQLQVALQAAAPTLHDSAWGHKYFSLIASDVIDPHHTTAYQTFHLVKLLQIPPADAGRYELAGRFVAIAKETDIRLEPLAVVFRHHHEGTPHRYWRISPAADEDGTAAWQVQRAGGFIGIGMPELGDLSELPTTRAGKEALRERVVQAHPGEALQFAHRVREQWFRFLAHINPGDLALFVAGMRVHGIARVLDEYEFARDGVPHRRRVEWLSDAGWELPVAEGGLDVVVALTQAENLVAIERQRRASLIQPGPHAPMDPLDGIPGRLDAALRRKKQVILYGPPGTGKTFWATRTARELAARSWFHSAYADLGEDQRQELERGTTSRAIELCTFHPSYGYEDFLEGYRPVQVDDGDLAFERRDGIFKRLCDRATTQPDRAYYLVIDEINRGDIPRIFGELLTLLEADKRGTAATLPLSGERFLVPPNVYVIGTMNTADRSIALLDTALRRRFAFVDLMPDSAVLEEVTIAGIPLGPWLDALNARIRLHVGRDARNLQVGHSYLMHNGRPIREVHRFIHALRDDILPLVEEYCYEDYDALEQILGPSLVDRESQRFRSELFEAGQQDSLVQAILNPNPELAEEVVEEEPTDDDADAGEQG